MIDRRVSDFVSLVWSAAIRVGLSAPRITDHILKALFPRTAAAAEDEGAYSMLRNGVKSAVSDVIRKSKPATDDQIDFAELSADFADLVRPLGSKTYFVEQLGEQVPVGELIDNPSLLDDARKFMRRKGIECLEEAARLDALYLAVVERQRFSVGPVTGGL